ncbi:hypothetical protein EV385_6746 [Krasilnikovia cinnamomea]|uniref:ARB-07466-like C-terminal domain-containing protein n=1 Tax=Krasilnikovia cinnamomea TaxID=349313 RepID=A0A4Q7ZA50_9ACTN|nr:hypothetical protein [Krasilnikovia cinnamomea]RZU46669.1 hypothetical protein EV385_6746 [Krasilnikovia cinnamomea]
MRLRTAAVIAAVLTVLCCVGTGVIGGGYRMLTSSASAGCDVSVDPDLSSPKVGDLNDEQRHNAAMIIAVGRQKKVPARGWVIAIATALQESNLHNLGDLGANNDHDSLGLFQQRPSAGWGTPAQILDPVYAAGKFYDKLITIADWATIPLTEAAQAVQISAYPDAYAKHEPLATALVNAQGPSGDLGLGCADMALGTAEPAPRNPDGTWPEESCSIVPDPTTGAGCLTPRTLHLVQQATAAGFPKPGCYRVDDHGEHPKGRACDFMMTSGGEASGAQKARGDAMAAWAVSNADRLGIKYVIWFRMIWTQTQGWHAYNNPFGGNDPSGWHTNHVHISMY